MISEVEEKGNMEDPSAMSGIWFSLIAAGAMSGQTSNRVSWRSFPFKVRTAPSIQENQIVPFESKPVFFFPLNKQNEMFVAQDFFQILSFFRVSTSM